MEIWDFRGNISMVHVTDVKGTTLTEQVADDYEQPGKQGRFSKKCIPRGYIPDLDWTTIHEDLDQPIKPVKQEEDPIQTTTTPAAPPEVMGPPSSHLRSKTKQQTTSIQQGQPECNPSTVDPLECNPAQRSTKCKLLQKFILQCNGHILSYEPRESQNIKHPLLPDLL